jgi:CheY-like chemotaxis protein
MTPLSPSDSGSIGLKGLLILVVEDSGETALSLTRVFQGQGAFKVELKASVRQALQRLNDPAQPLPDLVVIDHTLVGERTGLDLALEMQKQSHLRHIKRVSYSSIDGDKLRRATQPYDAPDDPVYHAIVPKPQSTTVLMRHLADLLKMQQLDELVQKIATLL